MLENNSILKFDRYEYINSNLVQIINAGQKYKLLLIKSSSVANIKN